MLRSFALAGLLLAALSVPAHAQEPAAAYCDDTLLVERFETHVDPPPRGIVSYAAVLRNALGEERSFVLVVTATLFQRPSSVPRSIPAGGRVTVELGYQAWQPGVVPLRGDSLAQVTRISCRPG